MSISFDPFPTLMTERLVLRQITDGNLDDFFILKSDERLLKYYDAKPRTNEGARLKLKELNDDISSSRSITWGIALKSSNRIIGSICYWNITESMTKAEIGYELMYDLQGKGIMHEAVRAVIDYGFNVMELKLIEATPNPNNASSVKLLEKNGFVRGAAGTETGAYGAASPQYVYYSLENKA